MLRHTCMQAGRMRAIRRAMLAMALFCGAYPALAQKPSGLPGGYPGKPIRIVVGSSPGGGTDIIARLIITRLAERWGHGFVVENHASGVGGVVGMDMVVKAPPDGYTLLVTANSAVVNAAVVTRVAAYDVRTALVPVAQFTSQPYVLAAEMSLPVATFSELLAYMKGRPAQFNYGSGGIGTAAHIGMEQLLALAGVKMVHIPYKGIGPAITDMMGGRVHMLFGGVLSVMPPARAGKIRAMAVTSPKRTTLLPDLPAIAASGVPGFEMTGWYGLMAPANTPIPVVVALNRGVLQVLALPEVQQKLAADGAEAPMVTSEQFRETMLSEIDKVARLVRETGLKLE